MHPSWHRDWSFSLAVSPNTKFQELRELREFVVIQVVDELIAKALHEDLGELGVDVTSVSMLDEALTGEATMVSREAGVLAGGVFVQQVATAVDEAVQVERYVADGDVIEAGQAVLKLIGPMRSLLTIERTALNLCCHLSGIATLTSQFVSACAGTSAKICDTRKTLPGLRGLQKYAVACGGGTTHRIGLYDAMLIKDNHLAGYSLDQLAERITEAAVTAKQLNPELKFVEVEVDTLEQLERVFIEAVDLVLLDNMTLDQLRQAVAMRDASGLPIGLEASGGVTLETVSDIAQTGVDRISVGALTHSAKSLDLGLDIR